MGLAADRGVTICFADLDGADGLWVPEERTILVSRRLSEQRVNEVIEHELAHVAIDDQHAELDAGVWTKDPAERGLLARRWATPVLSAAAFAALVGGATLGLTAALPGGEPRDVTQTSQLPLPSESGGAPPQPTTSLSPTVDANGNTYYRTVTITPSVPGSPSVTRASGIPATPTSPVSTRQPGGIQPPPVNETTPPAGTTTPPPTPDPTTPSPTPEETPTSPAGASATAGIEDG